MIRETTKKEATKMFLDTRFYGKYRMDRENGADYGRDLKQLLMAHMRMFIPMATHGVERERERNKERNRLVNAITKPRNRRQFMRAIGEIVDDSINAEEFGIITRGNPAYATQIGLPKGELNEVELVERARAYCLQLQYAAKKYPWLFYKIMVFGLGFREWRFIDKKWVQYRPFGYYQKQ